MNPAPLRMCVRCDKTTDQPVLVTEIHGDSGPGWNVYACPECAPLYPPPGDPIALLDSTQGHHSPEENDR